jgi:GNAT superfamily N-acetyltransferase
MVEIRPARPEDARAIARVHVAVWQTAYRGILPDDVLDEMSVDESEANWRDILTAHARTHPVLAVEEFGLGIVGFGNGGPLRGNAVPPYTGEFKTLYLLPAFQRRGIGRRLFGRLAAGLVERGHGAALAWVLAESPARGFFEAMGGALAAERVEEVEDMAFEDVAYGWPDLGVLARAGES